MEKVRIGLVGLGLMGAPHARILKKVEECELVAASDVDEKQGKVAEDLGIKFYRSYEEMIAKESVQGVISPFRTISMRRSASSAPGRGFIFLSRSRLPRASRGRPLIAAARENKVQILVGHQRRFSSLVEKAARS
jgi:predicted dehydrogenase